MQTAFDHGLDAIRAGLCQGNFTPYAAKKGNVLLNEKALGKADIKKVHVVFFPLSRQTLVHVERGEGTHFVSLTERNEDALTTSCMA